MVHLDHNPARDANGRFVPGSSGNPAGKRPGTRNRATILAAALAEGEAETVARVVIDRALAGDAAAARFVMDRLSPRPRGRAIKLPLPEGESAGGEVVAMFNSALRAMAAGDITPDEAVTVSRFLEGRMRVLRAWQMERRMTTYEDQPPIPGDDWIPDEEEDAPGIATADEAADPSTRTACPEEKPQAASRRGPAQDEGSNEISPSPAASFPRPEPQRSGESKDAATAPGRLPHSRCSGIPPLHLHSACISPLGRASGAASQPRDIRRLMSGQALVM